MKTVQADNGPLLRAEIHPIIKRMPILLVLTAGLTVFYYSLILKKKVKKNHSINIGIYLKSNSFGPEFGGRKPNK